MGATRGTRAGPARIHGITRNADFSGFRVAPQTPFNNVLEVTP